MFNRKDLRFLVSVAIGDVITNDIGNISKVTMEIMLIKLPRSFRGLDGFSKLAVNVSYFDAVNSTDGDDESPNGEE